MRFIRDDGITIWYSVPSAIVLMMDHGGLGAAPPGTLRLLLFAGEASSERIGRVTSGGFGPTLNAPIAMGYVPTELSALGTRVFADVRGQRLPLIVAPMPFVPNGYKR